VGRCAGFACWRYVRVRVDGVDVGVDRLREAVYFAQKHHDPDVFEDEVLKVPMV